MTKYKRWILLLTALTVFVVHIESLKATSLIHAGKFSKLLNTTTSTTSSSTTEEPTSDHLREILDEMPTDSDDEKFVEVNGTKIALTGIPQIDYVWDPNLPRELNGFNLSSYPFIDSMPAEEDIGFDCEDKINGFYASIKFSCQIYHHCLYGVRSDFICANFTAFDQKTFICHFASEVDCKNSYKYWNRNDDLYKATTEKSTTSSGVAPLFDRNLYKRPPPGTETRNLNAKSNQPLQPLVTKDTFKPEPAPVPQHPPARGVIGDVDYIAPAVQRPARPLRRPYRRRRPQIDYYYYDDEEYEDDFYDDRGRRRQQRPRNRRPIYDDYRDTRRPLSDDDFDDYEYERRPYRSRNRSESRRTGDDRRKHEDRRFDDRRRPYIDDRKPLDDRKRPEDERRSYDDRRYSDDRRTIDDRKRYDEERSQSDDRKYSRRKNPVDDPIDDKRRVPDRHESEKRQTAEEPAAEEKPTKPLGSIFDRARPSPRIPRPVPLNEKSKFAYKHSDKPSHVENEKKDKDEEYYEEYEDAPLSSSTTTSTTTAKPTTTKYSPRLKTLTTPLARKPSTTSTLAPESEYYEDEYYDTTAKPVETSTVQKLSDRALLFNARRAAIENLTQPPPPSSGSSTQSYQAASVPDNFRLNRFKSPSAKLINETAIRDNAQKTSLPFVEETSSTTTTTTRKPLPSISYNSKKFANQQTIFDPTTTETPKASTTESISHIINPRFNNRPEEPVELEPVTDEKDQKYLMRVIKRPFLPSRGGNPYKGRGLQPVGPASHQLSDQIQAIDNPSFTSQGSELSTFTSEGSQVNIEPSLNNFNEPEQQTPLRTTLDDIYNEEYDVELNDALNPMLKPLTSSRGISGFSFSSLPNADKDGYRAQSQKSIQKAEAPSTTSTTTTSTEAPQYEYEEVEYDYK